MTCIFTSFELKIKEEEREREKKREKISHMSLCSEIRL